MYGMPVGKLIVTVITYLIAYAIDPFIFTVVFDMFFKSKRQDKYLTSAFTFISLYLLICIKQALYLFTDTSYGSFMAPLILIHILLIVAFAYKATAKCKIVVVILAYTLPFLVEALYSLVLITLNITPSKITTFGLESALITFIIRMTDLLAYFCCGQAFL